MLSPQAFIDNLKQELLLTDIGSNENDKRAIDKHLKRLNNALEKLSIELYKKDTHFFLELIQNADDNQYSDNVIPCIKFLITQKRIIVQNNEQGFTEENVRSLCDVGESTKSDRYKGYIGEKGIGFKSVFKISDSPQIFSNGFNFRFRRENQTDKLGFIVPHWVSEIPNDIELELTNIVLPFNKEGKNRLIKNISNISRELNHEVILFLNKIKEIEIINEVSNSLIQIVRIESDEIIIIQELIYEQRENEVNSYSQNNEYWYKLIEQEFEIPNDIKEEKRENVKNSKIILGFPLSKQREVISIKQKVFAYLPIQEYGFKFLIQADFILPSTRENINYDNDWNQWLLEKIPLVFLEAVEYFKQEISLKYQYYNYLPKLEEIIDPQFYLMTKKIYDLLKNHNCILTESGTWRRPPEVLFVDQGIRELFSSQDIYKLIGKEYISNNVSNQVNSYILKELGVCDFSSKNLLNCLSNIIFLSKKSDEWLVKIYCYLSDAKANNKISVNDLRQLKILRIDNNIMTSVNEGDIFLHIPNKKNYGLDDVRTLKPISLSKARKLLKDIGVFDNDPTTIISKYILTIFQDDTWKTKDDKVLVSLLKYIRDNKGRLTQNYIDTLKNNLWIKNSHPDICQFSRANFLFFAKNYYGCNKNHEFDAIKEIVEPNKFISPDYIINQSDAEITLWKELFTILGVQEISQTKVIEYIVDIFDNHSKWKYKKHDTLFKCIKYIKNNYQHIYNDHLSGKIKNTLWLKNSNPELIDNPNELCYSKPSDIYLVSNPNERQNDLEFLLELVDQNNYFISSDYLKKSSEVSQWYEFFKWLGVKEITPYEIIKRFILPLYKEQEKSKNYLSKSENINVRCIQYIKDNFAQLTHDKFLVQEIQSSLRISCENLIKNFTGYWTARNLYIGQIYNNELCIESFLKDIKDVYFVSSLYLTDISNDGKSIQSTEAVNLWKNFFIKLGVNTKPKVEIISNILSFKQYERNKLLLQTLDKYWDDYKSQCQENTYNYSQEATWFKDLKTSAWIPTTNKLLAKPSEVFIAKPNIVNILGDSVFYVAVELNNIDFINAIGINNNPTVSAILDKLNQLSNSKSQEQDFLTDLYILLSKKFNQRNETQIKSAFQKNNLIYIPNTSQVYFRMEQVFWHDCSSKFGKKLRGYLEEYYPNLYSFFVEQLKVKKNPYPQDYANILIDLSKQSKLNNEDKKVIWRVYRELDKYLEPEQIQTPLISQESWWAAFIQKPIIYTHKNDFSRNHENLFVNDDEQLFTLFQDKQAIDFLQLPPDTSYYQIQHLLKEINVKYISARVDIQLFINENPIQELEITKQIKSVLVYILRYLYHYENKSFRRLKLDRTLDNFQHLQCYIVNELTVKYLLQEESVLSHKNVFLDKSSNKLYIQYNHLQDTDSVAIELANFFGNVNFNLKALADFLIILFEKKTEIKITKYLKAQKISDLPFEEKQYFKLTEDEQINNEYLADYELEEVTEVNNFVMEDNISKIDSTPKDDLHTNSGDLTVSSQQPKNQSEIASENLIFVKTQVSPKNKANPQTYTTKVGNKNSQSNYQDLQNNSNYNVDYLITNEEEIDNDSNEIDDIDLNLTNNVDRRERITTEIVQRPEQADFRDRLLKLYNRRCAITGYDAENALIAAHIIPYKISQDDRASNGLLLRADIHILFDRHLIAINSTTMTVKIAPRLTHTKYSELDGKKLNLPKVSKKALKWHYDKCQWV